MFAARTFQVSVWWVKVRLVKICISKTLPWDCTSPQMTSLKCRHRHQSHKLHHCGWKVETADCKHLIHLSVLHKNGSCQSTFYVHGMYVTANHELYWTSAHRHFFCNSSFLQRGSTFRRSNRVLVILNNEGLISWKPPTKGIQVNKKCSIANLTEGPFLGILFIVDK